jgi:cation diffusion facilitator family transporter
VSKNNPPPSKKNTGPLPGSITSQKIVAARLSVYSNTLLVILKLIAGGLSGSVGVLSEAAHSATDLIASWIALFAVRAADTPPDEDHPYGHGKIESLSGMAEALLIFVAGAYIIYEAVTKLMHRGMPHSTGLGIIVMGISVVVNILVARHLFNVARKTDSLALSSDAEHLRADVFTSAGVIIGLVLVRFTGLWWIDPAVALAVALMILHASWRLTRGALNPLLDTQLPPDELETVRAVLEADPAVLAYHKLRARKSGSFRLVDAHVLMDDNLTLLQAHDLTEALEDRIREKLPNTEVTLHTEPYHAESHHQYEHHGGPPPGSFKEED